VDDEPLAIDALAEHVNKIPELVVEARCSDAIEAFEMLQKKPVDLIFLDINMPEMTGLSFLKSLKNPPKVIITTAYRDYAVDAFDLDVVDYLVKPISFERFMHAIDKYHQQLSENIKISQDEKGGGGSTMDFILIKAEKKMQKIDLAEIDFIESIKDYCKILCGDRIIISKVKISELESRLPENQFLRIHRSYIISIRKITAFTNSSVELGKRELPVGRLYKNLVQLALNKYFETN
jgi:DNA-binding LytR/AlgR family response regulator